MFYNFSFFFFFVFFFFAKPSVDFIQLWRDDRALSQILFSTIPTQCMALRSRSQTLNFFLLIFTVSVVAKPLIDLNRVWYEWIYAFIYQNCDIFIQMFNDILLEKRWEPCLQITRE